MKKFLVLLVALALLCSAAMAKGDHHFHSLSCSQSNPMRENFRSLGITIFPKSVQNREYCQGEWDIHGTCCSIQQVSDYTTKKTQENDDSLKLILADLERIGPDLESFLKTYLEEDENSGASANSQQKFKPWLFKNPSSMQNLGQARSLQSTASQNTSVVPQTSGNSTEHQVEIENLKSKISEVVAHLKETKGSLISQQTKCMSKINLIVAVSPCSICSGNSDQYFSFGRLKLEERVCRDVLADCHQAWARLVGISKKVQTFSALASKLIGAEIHKFSTLSNPGFYTMGSSIKKIAQKKEIWQELAACEDPEQCEFQDAAELCEKFISLHKSNYAQKLGQEIKAKVARETEKLKKKIKEKKDKKKGGSKKEKKSKKDDHANKSAWKTSQKAAGQKGKSKDEDHHAGAGKARKLLLLGGSNMGGSEIGVTENKSCRPCAPLTNMDGP